MRRIGLRYGLILMALLGPGVPGFAAAPAVPASAPQVQVHAELDPPQVPFHRTAEYRLIVEAPAGLALQWPEWTATLDKLEVHAGSPQATPLADGRERTVRAWKLEPLVKADYLLPSLTLKWEGGEASVPALAFQVRDLTDAEREAAESFLGIVTPDAVAPPRGSLPWWVWAIVAACLGATAFWIYQRMRVPLPLPAPPPPWEVAQRRLKELAQRKLHEQGRYEPFYVDLSSILRYYLEDRFDLRAPEQTTQEFLETAQRAGELSEAQQQFLEHLLRHCDRVKFAQYRPEPGEMLESFASVERFVRETRALLGGLAPEATREDAA